MTDTTYAVLEALACGRPGCACARAVRRGHGLTHCPVHDDRTPSLSVDLKGGRLLWNCRAGCAQEAVLAELQRRGLLHELRDHAGRLLAFHERKGRWLQPDGRIGLNGTSSKDMLYGLERVAEADAGRAVVVVEGEKAAAALHGLDVLAVGTTCGAASTPAPEVLRHLRGRPVVLWPDADEPGLRHMARVAGELRRLGAQVLEIEWPQAPEHGDAADFVEQLDDQVDDDARRRVVLDFLRTAKPAPSPPPAQTVPAVVTAATWRPVDLAAVLADDRPALEPTVLRRSDGVALLYAGKVHAIIGEPESGKSWVAQLAVAEVLSAAGTALYIDGEKDARDMVGRLMALGVAPQTLAERLVYVRPEEPFTPAARAELMAAIKGLDLGLTVIDSVEALMTAGGLDPNSRKDYGGWHADLARPLQVLTTGPTVLIDHPIKDTEKRGAWASGAGNKRAAIDVSFLVERIAAFGHGQEGSARITIGKDSPGALRRHELATGGIAVFRLGEADGVVSAELLAGVAAEAAAPKKAFRPTHLMERVSRYVEESDRPPTKYRVLEAVTGKRDAVGQAVDVLAQEGYLAPEQAGRGTAYRSIRPYREAAETADGEPVPGTVPNGSPGTGSLGSPTPPHGGGTWEPFRRFPAHGTVPGCQHPTTSTVNGVTQCLSCPESWPRPVLMTTEVDG